MNIRIINKSKHGLPAYSNGSSAGMDICAYNEKEIVLKPIRRTIVKTGLFLEIPNRYEAQIRQRNGLAINKGINVLNSPGTIDADYKGEVCIIKINLSDECYVIKDGDRICQMVIAKHEKEDWISVDSLLETDRVIGGFGHTGKE
jgi:dUTP pyrophosphatase